MKAPPWGTPADRTRRRNLYQGADTPERLYGHIGHLEAVRAAAPEGVALDWVERDLAWLRARRAWVMARQRAALRRRKPRLKLATPVTWDKDLLYLAALADHATHLRREGLSTYQIARRLNVSQSWVYRRVGGVNDPRNPCEPVER